MQINPKKIKNVLIGSGGEANVYVHASRDNRVMKIFHDSIPCDIKQQKVNFLLKANLPGGVVLPLEGIYDLDNKFIGYTMGRITEAEPLHQLTKTKHCQRNGLDLRAILRILVHMGSSLKEIHKNGFVVGDLNDHNILVRSSACYFIDVDSWGNPGKGLNPDAFTDIFVPPESLINGKRVLTDKTDNFSFGVIAFNCLTKIHPFGGTYKPQPNMFTYERISKKISVMGKHDIIIPKLISSWSWMSPDLQKAFLEMFEGNMRENIVELLFDQSIKSTFCPTHNGHYYNKYSECPICSKNAKITGGVSIQVPKKVSSDTFKIKPIFVGENVKFFIGFDKYLNDGSFITHIASGRVRADHSIGHIEWSKDGSIIFDLFPEGIHIIQGGIADDVLRIENSPVQVINNQLYYVKQNGELTCLSLFPVGNYERKIMDVRNPLFCANELGDMFVLQRYTNMNKSMVDLVSEETNRNRMIEIEPVSIHVDEYFIQQDPLTLNWIFVYKDPNTGRFHTYIFSAKGAGILVNTKSVNYYADSLNSLSFINNTIYAPEDGQIVGTNLVTGASKIFPLDIVTTSSNIKMTNGGVIHVTSGNTIYEVTVKK